jgi:hypothetical protein
MASRADHVLLANLRGEVTKQHKCRPSGSQLVLVNNGIAEELPTRKLLLQNFSMFNEEPRELGFAVLVRAVLDDHVKDLVELMNKRFLIVREHQQKDDALRADNGTTLKTDSCWRTS